MRHTHPLHSLVLLLLLLGLGLLLLFFLCTKHLRLKFKQLPSDLVRRRSILRLTSTTGHVLGDAQKLNERRIDWERFGISCWLSG